MKESERCPHCGRLPLPNKRNIEEVQELFLKRIMGRIYANPKYKGNMRDLAFTKAEVKKLLDLFEWKSIWSNESRDITLTRINKELPLSFKNCMVVTITEAFGVTPDYVINKAKDLHRKYVPEPETDTKRPAEEETPREKSKSPRLEEPLTAETSLEALLTC